MPFLIYPFIQRAWYFSQLFLQHMVNIQLGYDICRISVVSFLLTSAVLTTRWYIYKSQTFLNLLTHLFFASQLKVCNRVLCVFATSVMHWKGRRSAAQQWENFFSSVPEAYLGCTFTFFFFGRIGLLIFLFLCFSVIVLLYGRLFIGAIPLCWLYHLLHLPCFVLPV